MTLKLVVAGLVLGVLGTPALACNPALAEPYQVTDPGFLEAAESFETAAPGSYARLAAYEKMLRVEGAAFGKVLRDGYLSEEPDLVAAAAHCNVLKANGAVARVVGLPDDSGGLNDQQQAQILTFAFTMANAGTDWSMGCFSTNKHPASGCNEAYFVAVRDGVVTFRQDYNTGRFEYGDGGFTGHIELRYGGPVYSVPATLTLQ